MMIQRYLQVWRADRLIIATLHVLVVLSFAAGYLARSWEPTKVATPASAPVPERLAELVRENLNTTEDPIEGFGSIDELTHWFELQKFWKLTIPRRTNILGRPLNKVMFGPQVHKMGVSVDLYFDDRGWVRAMTTETWGDAASEFVALRDKPRLGHTHKEETKAIEDAIYVVTGVDIGAALKGVKWKYEPSMSKTASSMLGGNDGLGWYGRCFDEEGRKIDIRLYGAGDLQRPKIGVIRYTIKDRDW